MSWKRRTLFFGGLFVFVSLYGCSSATPADEQNNPPVKATDISIETPIVASTKVADAADVISVEVRGEEGAYQFSVQISSPDEGCNQYADWWEVVDEGGELVYRRILLHSHVNEQPFTRSGGPVNIAPDTVVWVRAHMHPGGYGGATMQGSVSQGFVEAELGFDFAPQLAESPPLPGGCDF